MVSNIIWTKVKFVRNLKGVKFAPRMTDLERQDLLKLCNDAMGQCGLKVQPLNEMNKDSINELYLSEVVSKSFINGDLAYKGYVNIGDVGVEIGGDDHVAISAKSNDIFSAYSKAKKIDKQLCNKLNFAYSDKYGFLSPDITNIGSGMNIEAKLLLPSIAQLNAIQALPKSQDKLTFKIECLNEKTGLCLVYTSANLGYTEKQICELTHLYIDNIIKCEIEASKTLAQEDSDHVLDMNARAKAILKNCINTSEEEVYFLSGNILTAINSGLEKDVAKDQINKILNLINLNKNNCKKLIQQIQKILK